MICALGFFTPGAQADSFAGRRVVITDARTSPQPAALVIALHGFTGTGASFQRKTRFDALARRHGFVVAYPNGLGRRWTDGNDARRTPDDVQYLEQLVGALVRDGRADPSQVFLAGHSNGGTMALRIACERPGLFAGIAVVAAKTWLRAPCPRGAPVAMLLMHGTADPVIPQAGLPPSDRSGGTVSADEMVRQWRARNGCASANVVREIDARDDGTAVKITHYTRCAAPFVSVSIDGHGHEWPGAGARFAWLQGPATQEIDAAALIWWFFAGL